MPLHIHLSPAAQERARDWYRENCLDYEWWDSDYDHWKEKLAALGFTDADIKFRGFYSQGDGASFTAGVSYLNTAQTTTRATRGLGGSPPG